MGLYDLTLYDVIERNVAIYRNNHGLVCGSTRMTFLELRDQVNLMAGGLSSLGVKKGDRIAVIALNCHHFFLLYGAAARLGAIMLPINWRLKPEEVAFILEDCEPTVIVAGTSYEDLVLEMAPRYSFIKEKITMGEGRGGFVSIHEVVSKAPQPPEVDLSTNDPYIIIHTAAVEGKPRGAVLTHGNIIAANIQAMALMGLDSKSAYLHVLPLFHIAGLNIAFQVMHAGGINVIMSRFDPELALKLIQEERITIIGTFPPMLNMLLENMESSSYDVSSLRVVSGLDHPDNIVRFQEKTGTEFWTGFGQTETSGFCTVCRFSERPGSAGKEAPLARVRLVDDYDNEVPIGEVGEITVRGPLVFQGYWQRSDDTAYTFREGWHHTGDMGMFDEEGYLWYVKRKAEKELIKPGGENVYPAEVEKALLKHPDVKEACVIGVPDKEWGEAVKAICVLKEGSGLTPQDLIDFVASHIARYKKPKFVTFVESLPRTKDGQVDRERIKSEHGGGSLGTSGG